ncbi:MAG TPA: hypothetical protein VH394_22630, partial [Thermoanaerobaculia bacterium]|nr:hypothetical protein [Thermoanaerobaculia bacterium]
MSRLGFPILLLALLAASPVLSQPPDLTYHTVTPCVLVDTRTTGGAFTAGETRTYNVAGSCGVPAWSNNVAQAQAVALTITAITPTGGGNIKAYAADQTNTTSVLNFTANINVANTTPVALAQTPGVGDIKINVSNWTTHVLLTVVGYYSRDIQTVHVHPVPGDGLASGTRLINALAAITDASATKRYVVKVEPGIYDVGATMLEMKPYVDIEGSGQQATIIKGVGNNDDSLVIGVVRGASSSELRDLQVQSAGSGPSQPISIAVIIYNADTSIRDVTISVTGLSTWGIRNSHAPSSIEGVTINSQASGTGYGIGNKFIPSTPSIKRTVIHVTANNVAYGISSVDGAAPKEIRDVEVDAAGGNLAYGFYLNSFQFGSPSSRITDSTLTSNDIGVYFSGDELDVEHSQIRGADFGIYSDVSGTI